MKIAAAAACKMAASNTIPEEENEIVSHHPIDIPRPDTAAWH
jgi:hypothetical protein